MKRKLVYEVGISDAEYPVAPVVEGKQVKCPFFVVWRKMLERCYCTKWKTKYLTYSGCTVCSDWLIFSNFKKWMQDQDWEGKELDKDLLIQGNKIYSADTCAFITCNLNNLFTLASGKRNYPLGVSWHSKNLRFQACISLNSKHVYLGSFKTTKAAHKAWQVAKKDIVYDVAMAQVDSRLKESLLLRYTKLQYDIDNQLETLSL